MDFSFSGFCLYAWCFKPTFLDKKEPWKPIKSDFYFGGKLHSRAKVLFHPDPSVLTPTYFFVNSEVIDIFHPLPYFTCKLCVLKGPRTFLFTVKSWLIIKRRLYDFESLVVQRLGTKNSERNYHFHKISFEKTSSRTKADWNSSKKCPNIDTKLFV